MIEESTRRELEGIRGKPGQNVITGDNIKYAGDFLNYKLVKLILEIWKWEKVSKM